MTYTCLALKDTMNFLVENLIPFKVCVHPSTNSACLLKKKLAR